MKVVEGLFNPAMIHGTSMLGVSNVVSSSVALCEPDIRPGLYSSIIVSGGNTLLQVKWYYGR